MTCHSSHVGAGFPNRLVTHKSSSLELGSQGPSCYHERSNVPRVLCRCVPHRRRSISRGTPKKSSLPEVPRLFLLLCFAAQSHLERPLVLTRYVCGGCALTLLSVVLLLWCPPWTCVFVLEPPGKPGRYSKYWIFTPSHLPPTCDETNRATGLRGWWSRRELLGAQGNHACALRSEGGKLSSIFSPSALSSKVARSRLLPGLPW